MPRTTPFSKVLEARAAFTGLPRRRTPSASCGTGAYRSKLPRVNESGAFESWSLPTPFRGAPGTQGRDPGSAAPSDQHVQDALTG